MPTVSAHVARPSPGTSTTSSGSWATATPSSSMPSSRSTHARFTAVRHEAGGVVAADAYFRASGRSPPRPRPTAPGSPTRSPRSPKPRQAHVPLVLVTGDEPTSGPRPWDVDQIALAAAVGARTYTVGRADAAATTRHRDRARPDVPRAHRAGDPVRRRRARGRARCPTRPNPGCPSRWRRAAVRRRGDPRCRRRARRRGAARCSSRAAAPGRRRWRGARCPCRRDRRADRVDGARTRDLPRPEFDLGVTGGFGAEAAMELVGQADVAVVSARRSTSSRCASGRCSPRHPRRSRSNRARGDPPARRRLRPRRCRAGRPRAPGGAATARRAKPWVARDRGRRGRSRVRTAGDGPRRQRPPRPPLGGARIAELLPDDRVVVSDGGHFIGWANMYWPVASPDRMMMVGTAFQSIGLGFPSVPGPRGRGRTRRSC